jgi:hypothetical protein
MVKRSRLAIAITAFLTAIVGVMVLWLWIEPDDEALVRQTILTVASGAREADLAETIRPIASDYRDASGLNRDSLRGLLIREYSARGPITVFIDDIQVMVEVDKAKASFYAILADGIHITSLDLMPADADVFWFEVELEKRRGDWLITGSRYEQRGGRGAFR